MIYAEICFCILSETNPSTYSFPLVTMAKACLTSLFATASTATFPGFPLDRKRSLHPLHSELHLSDAKTVT